MGYIDTINKAKAHTDAQNKLNNDAHSDAQKLRAYLASAAKQERDMQDIQRSKEAYEVGKSHGGEDMQKQIWAAMQERANRGVPINGGFVE